MNTVNSILLFSLLAICTYAADPCAFSATARPRSGASWVDNGVQNQIYDILIQNTGTCELTRINAVFAYPPTASISQVFNFNSSTGEIKGYGTSLAPGAPFSGAGFVLSGTGSPTLAIMHPTCPSTCTAPAATPVPATSAPVATSAPATSAPTAKPVATVAPTATSAPTAKPVATVAPTSAPSGTSPCQDVQGSITATIAKRANSDFTRDGVNNAIYDLHFTAAKNVKVGSLVISITPGTSVSESWNIKAVTGQPNTFSVDTYGAIDKQGAEFNGAGFVFSGTGVPTLGLVSFTCSA